MVITADCLSAHGSSILPRVAKLNAPMAELADAPDLGSGAERCESSSLSWGTKVLGGEQHWRLQRTVNPSSSDTTGFDSLTTHQFRPVS